jgi:hypothetical protein
MVVIMALYIKYTGDDVKVLDLYGYIEQSGDEYGLGAITKSGTLTEIAIFVPDGVIK